MGNLLIVKVFISESCVTLSNTRVRFWKLCENIHVIHWYSFLSTTKNNTCFLEYFFNSFLFNSDFRGIKFVWIKFVCPANRNPSPPDFLLSAICHLPLVLVSEKLRVWHKQVNFFSILLMNLWQYNDLRNYYILNRLNRVYEHMSLLIKHGFCRCRSATIASLVKIELFDPI